MATFAVLVQLTIDKSTPIALNGIIAAITFFNQSRNQPVHETQETTPEAMPFQFEQHNIRIVTDDDNLSWFNANDICAALALKNPRESLSKHVSADDVAQWDTIDGLGRTQPSNHVNESGMYGLIFGSRKPAAKRFKRWIVAEVLPSIRETGKYEPKESQAINVTQSLVNEIFAVEQAVEILKISDASKLEMLSTVFKKHNISTRLLPDYTGDRITRSLSALLKQHEIGISAKKANLVLIKLDILTVNSRPSKKKGSVEMKQFKSLTEKGLHYGKNLVSKQNEKETQPHYFEDTFQDLAKLILE